MQASLICVGHTDGVMFPYEMTFMFIPGVQTKKGSFITAKYLHQPAICSYRCVVLLPYLWQDNQVVKQFEQTHEKTPEKEKKASLRSQGGGFTPQLDNTHQICEDSKS